MGKNRDALIAAYQHKTPEFVPNSNKYNLVFRCPTDRYYGPGNEGRDKFGVKWLVPEPDNPYHGMCPDPSENLLEDIADWKNIKFPDLDEIDWDAALSVVPPIGQREDVIITATLSSGLFERMNQLMGMENALCAFYEDPDSVKAFFDAMEEFKFQCIDKVVEKGQPDVIMMHDDWGTNRSMFFSPEMWREFIMPHEKRFVDYIHKKGCFYEHHSCGYIAPVLPDMAEIGIDAVNPLNICNDLPKLRKELGNRITFCGGYNNLYLESAGLSEEEFKASVRNTIDIMAPGGSYVSYYIADCEKTLTWVIEEVDRYGMNFYR